MKKNILIADDESKIREFLRIYFNLEGYNVYEAKDGKEAINVFLNREIDLLVIDIMMPELNGFEVCKFVREKSNIPIIILTALEEEHQHLLGYELGADDYITKPVKAKILIAKAKRLLNRNQYSQAILQYKELRIDLEGREVFLNNENVYFAPKEFELLVLLVQNYGRVLTREKILLTVWEYDFEGTTRVVDNHIKKIRKKLKDYSNFINTVIAVGYKFEVK